MFLIFFFFFKQKTAYEMRISDWSSDVCSSDLVRRDRGKCRADRRGGRLRDHPFRRSDPDPAAESGSRRRAFRRVERGDRDQQGARSEEHTSELQSLMRSSYAVFCLETTYYSMLLEQ